jgi:uncharacterized phiE125 gp8 family phage protein
MQSDAGRLTLVTAPVEEPLTVAQAKAHCRVVHDAEDALFARWIAAARGVCESSLRRKFVTQTWDWTLSGFPCRRWLDLPYPPLQSITSITYVDPDGAIQVMDLADVAVQPGSPGRVVLKSGMSWPTVKSDPDVVVVQFVCGYGAGADVPAAIAQAMALLIGESSEFRETLISGTILARLPRTVEDLLNSESWGSYV